MIVFSKKKMKESPDIKYKEAVEKPILYKENQSFSQEKFDAIVDSMEKARLAEYATYISHPFRLLVMNFLIGLARGLGGTIGLAVILTIIGVILKNIIYMHLPGISEWLQNMVNIAQSYKG